MDDYKPFEHAYAGNDLMALQRAQTRCMLAASNPNLSWFERERAMELLRAGSLVEYEHIRAAWSEVAALLPPNNQPNGATKGM